MAAPRASATRGALVAPGRPLVVPSAFTVSPEKGRDFASVMSANSESTSELSSEAACAGVSLTAITAKASAYTVRASVVVFGSRTAAVMASATRTEPAVSKRPHSVTRAALSSSLVNMMLFALRRTRTRSSAACRPPGGSRHLAALVRTVMWPERMYSSL